MRRKVTPLTRQRAFATIKIVAQAMLEGEKVISYSDLAIRLKMSNPTGRGLGPILDEAAAMCRDHKLPDVSAVIVTKESIEQGIPMPSSDSFDANDFWAITGIYRDQVPEYQEKVQAFDWKIVKSLGLQ